MASCCRHDGLFDFERKTVFDPATAAYNAARREARPSPRLSRPPAGNHTRCAARWRAPGSIPGLALMAGLPVPPARRQGSCHTSDKRSRSEEHTSELQSLMRISYAVFCLKKTKKAPHTE